MLITTERGLPAYLAEYGISVAQLPEITGRYTGKSLIVCGDAACVWADLERFGAKTDAGRGGVKKPGWDLMTVNKMVETLPGHIEHCFCNEPRTLQRFIAARRPEYPREFGRHENSHALAPGCAWVWPFPGQGTSGLGAVLAGLGMGYERIVLAGMPLDDGPHNGEPPWRRTKFATSEARDDAEGSDRFWRKARDLAFEGKVRSLSGRTRDWLGDAAEWT